MYVKTAIKTSEQLSLIVLPAV